MTGPSIQFKINIIFQDCLFLQQNTLFFGAGDIQFRKKNFNASRTQTQFHAFLSWGSAAMNKLVPLVF